MPGIQTYREANRQRIERQNRYNLADLEVELIAFDEALPLERGDIFDVNSPDLVGKRFRCVNVEGAKEIGQWLVQGEEYDPTLYSDTEESEPTYPDTALGSCRDSGWPRRLRDGGSLDR